MNSAERASANGWLRIGVIQLVRSPWAMRSSSCRKRARPTVATSACWPLARRSGMNTQRARRKSPAERHHRRQPKAAASSGRRRQARQRQRRHRAAIAARRGQFAEGEVDPPDQAVDQRIGGGEQGVDRRRAAGRRAPSGERKRRDFGTTGALLQAAERRRVGGAAFRGREPVADEDEEPRLVERLAVERQRDQIARLPRPSGLAKAAGGEMRVRARFAGRRRGEADGEAAAVRVGALADDVDCARRRASAPAAPCGRAGPDRSRAPVEQPATRPAARRTTRSRIMRRAFAPRAASAWRDCRRPPSRTTVGDCSWSCRRRASRRHGRRSV